MKVFLGASPGYQNEWHVFPFAKTLATYLERTGHAWTLDPREPGIDVAMLVQWSTDLEAVRELKSRGVPLVHRLDGRARSLVKNYDKDELNREINALADWTVFQSEYVRRHVTRPAETFFGTEEPVALDAARSSLIYNGVDRSVFNERVTPRAFDDGAELRFLHVAFTSNVRKGVGDVVRLAELLRSNPRVRFVCLGRQAEDAVWGVRLRRLENVTLLGATGDRETIAATMRGCSALLFPSRNDYCPNTVLEAMSCGLPVIYHDSGGTPELVRDEIDAAGVAMSEPNPVYPLHAVAEHLDELSRRAVEMVKRRFTMERMGGAYVELFERLLGHAQRPSGDAVAGGGMVATGSDASGSVGGRLSA